MLSICFVGSKGGSSGSEFSAGISSIGGDSCGIVGMSALLTVGVRGCLGVRRSLLSLLLSRYDRWKRRSCRLLVFGSRRLLLSWFRRNDGQLLLRYSLSRCISWNVRENLCVLSFRH